MKLDLIKTDRIDINIKQIIEFYGKSVNKNVYFVNVNELVINPNTVDFIYLTLADGCYWDCDVVGDIIIKIYSTYLYNLYDTINFEQDQNLTLYFQEYFTDMDVYMEIYQSPFDMSFDVLNHDFKKMDIDEFNNSIIEIIVKFIKNYDIR